MEFTKDDIPKNSGLAVWHFAKLVSAMDGKITESEHLGLVNTMKVTAGVAASMAANEGENPEEAMQSFLDSSEDLTRFWNDPGPIDDAFIDHALGLITKPIWANFAIAVATFASGVDEWQEPETWLIEKAFQTWECEEEEAGKWFIELAKVASGE